MVLTATMAASVLALRLNPAQSLPLGGKIAGPDAAVENAQQKEIAPGPGPGMGGQGSQGSQGQGSRVQGGQGQGGSAIGGPGEGGGRMRGEVPQFRSGERGSYGYGPRSGERGERGRLWIGREHGRGHMRRHYGRRGWDGGPAYGFCADCGWLRQRALQTGSRYWWRQYRDCMH